jgi:SAM-dependent methyltransferase
MTNPVKEHYQKHPYPTYPLIASVRRCDTYALNIEALWARFNHELPPPEANRILIAGSGTFAPYPFAVANPDAHITAIDLSERSLRRARWHCLLHGRHNISYNCGDFVEHDVIQGKFGMIDSFGVLHHLEKPLAGLKKLESHLMPGGILRIMLYNRYARREEDSIRRAFKLLGINSVEKARTLLNKAVSGSRLSNYLNYSDEPGTASGLADALLHPRVHTYTVEGLLELISQTDLELLMFAHSDALENPEDEILRLKELEQRREFSGNYVIYLRKNISKAKPKPAESVLMLNPCLISSVGRFKFGTLRIPPRLGVANSPLSYSDRSFLRQFVKPVINKKLSDDEIKKVLYYQRLLLLLEYS